MKAVKNDCSMLLVLMKLFVILMLALKIERLWKRERKKKGE